jgi:hypothetical protein
MGSSFLRQRFVGFGIVATVSASTPPARGSNGTIGVPRFVVCSPAYICGRGVDASQGGG